MFYTCGNKYFWYLNSQKGLNISFRGNDSAVILQRDEKKNLPHGPSVQASVKVLLQIRCRILDFFLYLRQLKVNLAKFDLDRIFEYVRLFTIRKITPIIKLHIWNYYSPYNYIWIVVIIFVCVLDKINIIFTKNYWVVRR